jgi:methylenetetrahydrofolate dehydrogenase (NADP+)/methenyltetrahydrofolate cyclohydrolase
MSATVLDGRATASAVVDDIAQRVRHLRRAPKLVFVQATDDAASASYVRSKARLAAKAGIENETVKLPASVDQQGLASVVQSLNDDDGVDGILVQLPLYPHLNAQAILEAIDPAKDVDGFHPVNVGKLWLGRAAWAPATPQGVLELLDRYAIEVKGVNVTIVGRSMLVGKPAAALFLQRDASVTVVHSRSRDMVEHVATADVIVAAAGRPGLVNRSMVKAGATVIDVGQSMHEGALVGDVAPDVIEVAAHVTPTPGGTGPMTVAMVVKNTLLAYEARAGEAA